ncbi:helix-turn-helix transcriptional regulator [Nocardioides campestrisoli]|uniref:helix-turn-helix transcriptional regulator n=1 Tax=Nocardioides campestrisoli TaxID=2736757 RepID=UPI0015E754E2|nr:AraC family transcriptional regulator [Nocardioides campestrisoli]
MDGHLRDDVAHRSTFRTTDPAKAEAAVGSTYEVSTRLVLPARDQRAFDMNLTEVRMASSMVGVLSFGAPARVVTDATSGYHVNLTLRGRAAGASNGAEATSTVAGEGLVYEPGAVTDAVWFRGCRVLTLFLSQRAVEEQLEKLLGRSLTGPLRPAPKAEGLARALGPAVQLALMQLDRDAPASAALQNHVEALLVDSFLLSHRHAYSEALERPGPAAPRTPVERAARLLEERPEHPWTTVSLATEVHLSTRALQDGFKRHFHCPPMAYLRGVRLRGAHAALTAAQPGETTVQEVALRHGIMHPGRFSVSYRQEFGESPSVTLARPAP